jgi:glycosyltransferase involved in cell wall biosynthesis
MYSGLPVIASRIGALPGIVADDLTGILVEPGSAAELAQAMRELGNDSARRLDMGKAAAMRARYFAAESVASQYEQHYRSLVSDSGRRRCE